jgi:hypothetical protein
VRVWVPIQLAAGDPDEAGDPEDEGEAPPLGDDRLVDPDGDADCVTGDDVAPVPVLLFLFMLLSSHQARSARRMRPMSHTHHGTPPSRRRTGISLFRFVMCRTLPVAPVF